ncbi:VCBS repeat-containing protein [Flavobacteriaceae bacterium TP-CH-4]|uniref:VCBS repeat-containing protein n=1 Tax=Pelagihabitans pacificus TaxID=2696054 RepID=A0A967AWX2_9FLAO|nr:VCBS repeat-containing protein [Pelagihabitans pacificus]NHF60658.1 VCBS repeat-containing protein [Pelagihabitans pacificus]
MKQVVAIVLMVVFSGCTAPVPSKESSPLFVLKDSTIGISFENVLTYDESFNPYLYRNFYNGGGVAIGDINNDGLEDIYFTGNMVDNKLFLNKGNWQFEDITEKAGVSCPNVWSSGATFADINGDGLLDLYVCKAGKPSGANRHNELFINNGDLTFTEASKQYGLAIEGLSVHAAFFDYDRDGDLDVYILNNSLRSIGAFDLVKDQRTIPDISGNGNKFFRNDQGSFVDITEEAGIYTSKIGFGLGITLGDFNNDNWTDIFISNDFFERDYLYINDTKGGFTEQLEDYFASISMGSMGADLADLNNDLLTDLMVTEMLPTTHERQKTKTIYESWDKQQLAVRQGYHHQYPRNTLQRNMGNDQFVEIGRQAGVSGTEWSWAALLFDMDNDGLRDIFVSNGIYKDLLDRDYLNFEANEETIKIRIAKNEKDVITRLIDAMPSKAIPNAAFHNLGNFEFEDKASEWGLNTPSFSNGSAYGDLDNDGDLDLVLNNVNMPSSVYENKTDTLTHRGIRFKFSQDNSNSRAVGAKAVIKYGDGTLSYSENYVSRGFESSVAEGTHFGVGNVRKIDSVWITWPDGTVSVETDLPTNQIYTLEYPMGRDSTKAAYKYPGRRSAAKAIAPLFNFVHKENNYIDFDNERLLGQMYSNEGPAFDVADLNGDFKTDFFVGGSKNQSGSLFLSDTSGYTEITHPFSNERNSEDTDALFFDADKDGDLDLYVCHGGRAFSPYSTDLHDSFYTNEKNGFEKGELPEFPNPISSSVVVSADYDQDGDLDLFVGERYKTNRYGLPGSGYLLKNDGKGHFKAEQENTLKNMGMITDAQWSDINSDGWPDLIILGEWMPIKLFINEKGKLVDKSTAYGFQGTSGLWKSIHVTDIDKDGDEDIVAGNMGANNFYEPQMKLFVADFDGNGFQEQIICKYIGGKYYPIADKDELVSQLPALKKKLLYYNEYAQADMATLFPKEILKKAYTVEIKMLESTIFYNENGKFVPVKLPPEIQYSPVYSITTEDIDADGNPDLFLGGNQFMVKPQFGRYDASFGWVLYGDIQKEKKLRRPLPLRIKGQIREMKWIKDTNGKILVTAINNDTVKFYGFEK